MVSYRNEYNRRFDDATRAICMDDGPIPYIVFSKITDAAEITVHGDTSRSWQLPNGDIIHEANTGVTTRLISHCACGDELPDGATFCVMCGKPVVQ